MSEFPTTNRRWLWILVATLALGVGLRALIYWQTNWTISDGYIYFRFAEQFGSGHGLVFNTGERVSGNTSFLWSFLLGLGVWAGINLPIWARILGISFDVASALLLWRMLSASPGLKKPELPVAITAALFLFPLTYPYAVSGMETSLFVMLVLLLMQRTLSKRDWLYYVAAALLMLCRPDGVLPVAMSLLFLTWKNRRLPWREGITVFLIGVGYLVFNWACYNSPIPNTVLAKAVGYHDGVAYNWSWLAARFFRSQVVLALVLAMALAVWSRYWKDEMIMLLGLLWLSSFLFVLSTPRFRSWYAVPFVLLCFLLIVLGAARVAESALAKLPAYFPVLALAIYVAGSVAATPILLRELREVSRSEQVTLFEPGQWLLENTPPDARVFVTTLELGYVSKRYTIDSPGLVSPAVWKMLKRDPSLDLFQQAEALKADYAYIPIQGTPSPPANFELIRRFATPNPSPSFSTSYALYKRKTL